MKKLLPFIFTAITISAVARPLTVNIVGNSPVKYYCNDSKKIIATYYALSDKSLQFVKLNFDKIEVTLPTVIPEVGADTVMVIKLNGGLKGAAQC